MIITTVPSHNTSMGASDPAVPVRRCRPSRCSTWTRRGTWSSASFRTWRLNGADVHEDWHKLLWTLLIHFNRAALITGRFKSKFQKIVGLDSGLNLLSGNELRVRTNAVNRFDCLNIHRQTPIISNSFFWTNDFDLPPNVKKVKF